ncbi:TetR/AcrR family transcriptional regulator [Eubacteriaceae bacterium ES2]|nr:TetR/AcrR family transcriptional regulator [Eubacteriaceae bacterium ES2]
MESEKTGLATRELIIQGCEELFYEKGYKETKFSSISGKTGKPKSLINYYFPVKADLVKELVKRLIEQIADLVDEHVEDDAIIKQLVFNHVFYQVINRDQQTGTFIAEVISRDERVLKLGDLFELFYYPLVETEGLDEAHIFGRKVFIYGCALELLKNYFMGIDRMDWQAIIVEINRLNLIMIGIPTVDINKYLDQSMDTVNRVDYSEIRLLNVKKD